MCSAQTSWVNTYGIGDERHDIRVRANPFELLSQVILVPLIVRVEKSDPSTISVFDASVSRCTNAAVGLR